jgi:transcriptional regulator with XRE-family HTH domain
MKISQLQQKIGQRIRILRESKGITQQDLAAACNFEKTNMSRIEAGRTNPTISTLYKISQALEITISELVDVEV